jgi:hypothetical protein
LFNSSALAAEKAAEQSVALLASVGLQPEDIDETVAAAHEIVAKTLSKLKQNFTHRNQKIADHGLFTPTISHETMAATGSTVDAEQSITSNIPDQLAHSVSVDLSRPISSFDLINVQGQAHPGNQQQRALQPMQLTLSEQYQLQPVLNREQLQHSADAENYQPRQQLLQPHQQQHDVLTLSHNVQCNFPSDTQPDQCRRLPDTTQSIAFSPMSHDLTMASPSQHQPIPRQRNQLRVNRARRVNERQKSASATPPPHHEQQHQQQQQLETSHNIHYRGNQDSLSMTRTLDSQLQPQEQTLMQRQVKKRAPQRPRVKWSKDEVDALAEGLEKYGAHWAAILSDKDLAPRFSFGRTQVQVNHNNNNKFPCILSIT